MNQDEFSEQLSAFAALSGCRAAAVARENEVLGILCADCPHRCSRCRDLHRHALRQSSESGVKFVYRCETGSTFCILPLTARERFLAAGPMDAGAFEAEKIGQIVSLLPVIADGLMHEKEQAGREVEQERRRRQLDNYIQSVKSRLLFGVNGYTPYPYDKEKQLTHAIVTGEREKANKYLNELLGYIFFASSEDLDTIKVRAMELTVLISRAALDGGADGNDIYRLNTELISDFFRLETIEDVCFALTDLLHKFSEVTFKTEKVKHVDLLSRAVSYMSTNYMHKITLEDVAAYSSISPSYLSKIFKEEMKTNFNNYLNTIRIDKSRILLSSDRLTIAEISGLVGFADQSYFNKVFRRLTGTTPKQYRQNQGISPPENDPDTGNDG